MFLISGVVNGLPSYLL